MTDLTPQQLAAMSPDQLYAQLGEEKVANMHTVFSNLMLTMADQEFAVQDTTAAGKSFFGNLNQTAYNFFCGNPMNKDSLKHLLAALGIIKDQDAIITAVAAVLMANLGWSTIIAGIVAALLIKVVFPAATESLCDAWKAQLSK